MTQDASTLDVDFHAFLKDEKRHFELNVRFSTAARFTALYGPSGSGKTLTLQAIAGLLHPGQGCIKLADTVFFDSAARINVRPSERRIGYLFQNYALFPHLTVRQNIEFGLTSWRRRRVTDAQRQRVDDLLHSFGLATMANSRPHTLSGGQQQRTALARALAREPQLLLLDEPFAALNPMLRATLRAELAQTCKQWNIPVIMITHDIDDVLALADVAFLYEQGQIVREVDIRTGRANDSFAQHARQALTGHSKPPPDARHERVRALLS